MKTGTVLVNGDFRVHKSGCRDLANDLKESDYTAPIEADYPSEEAAVRDLWDDIIGDYGKTADEVDVNFLYEHGLVGATHFYPCTHPKRGGLTPMPDPDETPRYSVVGPDAKDRWFVHDAEAGDITGPSYKTEDAATKAAEKLNAEPPADDETDDRPTRTDRDREEDVLAGVSTPARSGRTRESKAKAAGDARRKAVGAPRPSGPALGSPATNGNGDGKREAKQELARGVVVRAVTSVKLSPEDQATVAAWIHHLPTGRDEDGRRWWPEGFARPDRSDWR